MLKPLAALFGVALLGAATASAEGWYAVTSDNFTLYSDAPAAETRELVENFELFRDTILGVLGLQDQPETQRLVIIAYANARDFGRIAPRNVVGFYYDSIFGPRMLMRGAHRDKSTQQTLFHEYVHYVMSQRSALNYPRWYSEGLATVLMTTEMGASILIGRPPERYAAAIGLGFRPTVHDVVTVRANAGFYLTSWLLAHYVSFGDPMRRLQTSDYLRRYDAGEDPLVAFQASLLLADIAVERDAWDAAHRYFEEAAKAAPNSPRRLNLLARRSIAYIHEKKVREGDALVAQLLEADTEDAQVLGDIAHYAYDKFVEIATERSPGDTALELERAIQYGLRATEADPENLEAHYYLGLSYEAAGQLQNAVDALLNGYDLGSSPRLNRDLARLLIKGRQHELASYLLERLVSMSHADAWRTQLRSVIDDLEDGEASADSEQFLAPTWARMPAQE